LLKVQQKVTKKRTSNNYCLAAIITPNQGFYCKFFSVYGDFGKNFPGLFSLPASEDFSHLTLTLSSRRGNF
jgi:hypothetical protein